MVAKRQPARAPQTYPPPYSFVGERPFFAARDHGAAIRARVTIEYAAGNRPSSTTS